jgi:hypothetical protein
MTALRMFGVVGLEGADGDSIAPNTMVVAFRDLGAVVTPATYEAREPTEADVEAHRKVVEAVFSNRSFLPAPVGVVFRSRDALARWLELHYVTLTDGLTFVESRVGARLHLSRRPGDGTDRVDIAAVAAEVFKALRPHAAASVSLKPRDGTRQASAAFLVDRDRWDGFVDMISEEAQQRPEFVFDQTGPWPPYDFVNMQFGE